MATGQSPQVWGCGLNIAVARGGVEPVFCLLLRSRDRGLDNLGWGDIQLRAAWEFQRKDSC